jgi:hypothetical protein
LPRAGGVHADAVAQQRTPALAAAGVDADDRDAQRVVLVQAQAADQLVRQARFARAARASDAQYRRLNRSCQGNQVKRQRVFLFRIIASGRFALVFQCCDQLRQRTPRCFGVALDGVESCGRVAGDVLVAAHHHLADHAGQAHALAVFRTVDAAHAIGLQLADFGGHDHAAAAAKHLNVAAAAFAQQVDHVFEVLHMPALVGADGNALHVFLQSGGHHVVHTAVVAQVNHLGAHALQDAAHDVDGGIVPVEQAGSGHETHLVGGAVVGQGFEFCGQVTHVWLSMGRFANRRVAQRATAGEGWSFCLEGLH